METNKIKKEVKILKTYSLLATLTFILFITLSFKNNHQRFTEIDVERINIVEKDGKVRMVITNEDRVPDPIMDGKVIGSREGAKDPAIGFYNEEGDEIGGLTFGVNNLGGQKVAKTALLFDQYKQDEVMQLVYQEVIGGNKIAGMQIKDRPANMTIVELADLFNSVQELEGQEKEKAMADLQRRSMNGEFGGSRLFVGTVNRLPMLTLNDQAGKTRLKIFVDQEGEPHLQFLNDKGEVSYTIPEE